MIFAAMEIGGVYYNLIKSSMTAVVAPSSKYSGEITIRSSVTVNGETYTVTGIMNGAFMNCTGVTSVTIPSGVKQIARNAFSGCTGLTKISIPNTIK